MRPLPSGSASFHSDAGARYHRIGSPTGLVALPSTTARSFGHGISGEPKVTLKGKGLAGAGVWADKNAGRNPQAETGGIEWLS